jgi:prevent-host-death family protein
MLTMDSVTSEVTTRERRGQLSEVLGRAMYGGERIGVTRNGKLAAVVVSVADLESLEAFELEQDVAAYREAKAADDGQRVSLEDLRRDLVS